MALFPGRQNPILEVLWQGWRSTSAALGRAGWNMALEENHYGFETRVLFHHQDLGLSLFGVMESQGLHMRDPRGDTRGWPPVVLNQLITKDTRVIMSDFNLEAMSWVETRPHVSMVEGNIHTLPLFRELAQPVAQSLIVDPSDVGRILDLIHKAQAPEQADIRARERSREQPMRLHAHIMSLAA